jgi:hypothetical protein
MNKKIIFLLTLLFYAISFVITRNPILSLVAIPVSIGMNAVIMNSQKQKDLFAYLFLGAAVAAMNGIYMMSIANRFTWFMTDPSLFRTLKIFSISLLFDLMFFLQIFIIKKARSSQ